jgi:hypothetical protein|tara:strand:- start:899 stop:1240 length:342 start_codon:yes stop_codon:yes gene_type:complete
MIIKCRYSSQDLSTGEYIFLVLDTWYKGHLHALSLREFNTRIFRNLAEQTGTTPVPGLLFEKNNVQRLTMTGSPRSTYQRLLKAGMANKYNTGYRTLDIKKMSGIMLIEYDFE